MSITINNTAQALINNNKSTILNLVSPSGVKLPVNAYGVIKNKIGTVGFINITPVTSATLASRVTASSVSVDFNKRLHLYTTDYYASMIIRDIDLIKEHVDTNLTNNVNIVAPRITALESKASLPLGTIMMWSGTTLPAGWGFCNGTTYSAAGQPATYSPDLRNRFVICTRNLTIGGWLGTDPIRKSNFYLRDTGGETTHVVSEAEMPQHSHILPWGEGYRQGSPWGYYGTGNQYGSRAGADWDNQWRYTSGVCNPVTNAEVGTSASHTNMPPYYKLAYIILYNAAI